MNFKPKINIHKLNFIYIHSNMKLKTKSLCIRKILIFKILKYRKLKLKFRINSSILKIK